MAGIVYISESRPDLLDNICNELYTAVTAKISEANLNEFIIKKGANLSHADPLVVDLFGLRDTADEIASATASFKTMYPDKRIAIIADKEERKSPVFARLYEIGAYNIAVNLESETLRKCLFENMTRADTEGLSDENPVNIAPEIGTEKHEDIVETTEKITADFEFKKHKQHVFVAVCGTQAHIGATHHALLICSFLRCAGFKVCYLEANKRRSIAHIADVYTVNSNADKHLIQFEGVDIYYEPKLNEILADKYDFVIFDFGSFDEIETPDIFLTKDVKIIIGGVKAWEMPVYPAVLQKIEGSRGINFIMNFATPSEFNEIRQSMSNYKIYFSEYAPYPFKSGINLEIYRDIFGDYLTIENIAVSEKRVKKNILNFWRE